MSKTKHTPGPWKIDWSSFYPHADGSTDGIIRDKNGIGFIRCPKKDVRLIAAAPEMLEALEHCLEYFRHYRPEYCGINDDRDCSPYNDAIVAIAKAEGREK